MPISAKVGAESAIGNPSSLARVNTDPFRDYLHPVSTLAGIHAVLN